MQALDIVISRWQGSPLDFGITAAMPLLVLAAIALLFSRLRVVLPWRFHATAVLASVAGLLYAPVCGCMGAAQLLGTIAIAFLVSLFFFAPVLIVYMMRIRVQRSGAAARDASGFLHECPECRWRMQEKPGES